MQYRVQRLNFGDVGIDSFAVSHDAREPLGYTFTEGLTSWRMLPIRVLLRTLLRLAVQGAETILLEANHDVQMLKEGTYPYVLKKRILSTKGHLDNMAAGWLLAGMTPVPQEIFLAHLSQENNRPETALEAVQASFGENRSLLLK
jgi:phosphoribosyl 1,2-cyclic phosphodiesterase